VRRRWLGVGILGAALSCGNSVPLVPTEAGSDGGLGATGIPDPGPGRDVDIAFQNVSPNNTPQDATPLGTSVATNGLLPVWITNNAIGGPGNQSNYFVFRSSAMPQEFIYRGCFDPPLKGMTGTLWKVVDHAEQLPPLGSAVSTPDSSMSQCLEVDNIVLEPNTVYLFQLTATGGAGLYSL
jgi:hypothetical protein